MRRHNLILTTIQIMTNESLNMQGKRFGRLFVLCVDPISSGRGLRWKCSCDCGTLVEVRGNALRAGQMKSCGCLRKEHRLREPCNHVGKRFGRLTVERLHHERDKSGQKLWSCVCDCGRRTAVRSGLLVNGNTKSCGCLKTACGKFHGVKWDIDLVTKLVQSGVSVNAAAKQVGVDYMNVYMALKRRGIIRTKSRAAPPTKP